MRHQKGPDGSGGQWGDGEGSRSARSLWQPKVWAQGMRKPPPVRRRAKEPHRFTADRLPSAKPIAHGKVSVPLGALSGVTRGDGAVLLPLPAALQPAGPPEYQSHNSGQG